MKISAVALIFSLSALFFGAASSYAQQPAAQPAQQVQQPAPATEQKKPMTADEVFFTVSNSLIQKTGEKGITKVETDVDGRVIRIFIKQDEPAPAMKPEEFRAKVLEGIRKDPNMVKAFELGNFTLETHVLFSDGKEFVASVSAKDLAQAK